MVISMDKVQPPRIDASMLYELGSDGKLNQNMDSTSQAGGVQQAG